MCWSFSAIFGEIGGIPVSFKIIQWNSDNCRRNRRNSGEFWKDLVKFWQFSAKSKRFRWMLKKYGEIVTMFGEIGIILVSFEKIRWNSDNRRRNWRNPGEFWKNSVKFWQFSAKSEKFRSILEKFGEIPDNFQRNRRDSGECGKNTVKSWQFQAKSEEFWWVLNKFGEKLKIFGEIREIPVNFEKIWWNSDNFRRNMRNSREFLKFSLYKCLYISMCPYISMEAEGYCLCGYAHALCGCGDSPRNHCARIKTKSNGLGPIAHLSCSVPCASTLRVCASRWSMRIRTWSLHMRRCPMPQNLAH